ncbi:MAG: choice-of-anchor J domain-containing protein, partial [Bacteroidetes bacterium]|nr:choice-of-anchor J domain-containing protein [Bacteroidota bacterium]
VYQYTFTTQADLSADGDYIIQAYTELPSDQDADNDTSEIAVSNVTPESVPYSCGFETDEERSGWIIEDANADDFFWSFYSSLGVGSSIAPAYSYNTDAVTPGDDWLYSTCLDLAAGNYRLDFQYRAYNATFPENMDVYIGDQQVSTAMTTQLVDLNAFDNNTFLLSSTIFTVATSGIYYIGFHCYSDPDMFRAIIDNVSITEVLNDDAGITAIEPIPATCDLGMTDITVDVTNFGFNTINSVDVSYSVNGEIPVTETVTATILSGETYNYTFTAQADLITDGDYTIVAYTELTGDEDISNDTTEISTTNFTPAAIPYLSEFEVTADLDGWVTEDANTDGYSWDVYTGQGIDGSTAVGYRYNAASAADDWLYTTCLDMAPGSYTLEFYYSVGSATWPEKLAVYFGDAQSSASMTNLVNDLGTLSNTTYMLSTNEVLVPAGGVYYFGFHCYSDADEYYLYIDSVAVTLNPCDVTASTNVDQDVSCFGGSDGIASVTPLTGYEPFTYSWDDGQTDSIASGLSAGSFDVTVTDYVSCTATAGVIITEPADLQTAVTSTNVSCNGFGDGSAYLSVTGGITPYNFIWNTFATDEDISGLYSGWYYVTITDTNGCVEYDSIEITEPDVLSLSVISADITCNGFNDGSADLTASGGTIPYDYLWSTAETTEDISNLSP